MTDRIGAVYAEKNTELLWPIGPGAVCDETKQDNYIIENIGVV